MHYSTASSTPKAPGLQHSDIQVCAVVATQGQICQNFASLFHLRACLPQFWHFVNC